MNNNNGAPRAADQYSTPAKGGTPKSQKLGQYAKENQTWAPKATNHGGDKGGGQSAGIHSSLRGNPSKQ